MYFYFGKCSNNNRLPTVLTPFSILLSLSPLIPAQDEAPQTPKAASGANADVKQIYLDVTAADTSTHLNLIRSLPMSTYKLSYERGGLGRTRVGPTGPALAALIPDAVEIVPKRTLPPAEKGGKPVIIENVPVVHEQTLFMYGLGATKELAHVLMAADADITAFKTASGELRSKLHRLESLTGSASDGGAELRMRASVANAKKAKAEVDIWSERAAAEVDYAERTAEQELRQLKKSEELVLQRLKREDESARQRAANGMSKKLETAKLLEDARASAAERQSLAEHGRALDIQRAKEALRAETLKAEAQAKAEAERANEDVRLRMLKAEGEQRRIRNVAAVKETFAWLGNGIRAMLNSPKDVCIFVGYFSMLALAIYVSREAAALCRSIIESLLGKPKLIRETSKRGAVSELFFAFFSLFKRKVTSKGQFEACERHFRDVVLPEDLKRRVVSLATSAAKAREYNAPHRHVLLYGPPGTGKTMVAKKMAECVGMDYAMMSGGDVGPLGADGVTQIHQLFRWAKMSRRGGLLFIDEAEAFLGSRGKSAMSESAHNALNAMLYNTGGERKDFMLVLATNRAGDLDAAVLDRCDESLLFPLPDEPCREVLLTQYFNTYVVNACNECNAREGVWWRRAIRALPVIGDKKWAILKVEDKARELKWMKRAIAVSDGFSGREIGKVMIGIQGLMYGSENGCISSVDIENMIDRKVKEHKEKEALKEKDAFRNGMSPRAARSTTTH